MRQIKVVPRTPVSPLAKRGFLYLSHFEEESLWN